MIAPTPSGVDVTRNPDNDWFFDRFDVFDDDVDPYEVAADDWLIETLRADQSPMSLDDPLVQNLVAWRDEVRLPVEDPAVEIWRDAMDAAVRRAGERERRREGWRWPLFAAARGLAKLCGGPSRGL